MDVIRPDFIFSYWIFIWFIIYYFISLPPIIKKYTNPLFSCWLALIENIFYFIYISIKTQNIFIIIYYLVMMLLMKGIPIYLLSKQKFNINWVAFLIVFLVYNIHLFIHKKNIIEIYKDTNKSLINSENRTPFFYIIRTFQDV